MSLQPRIAAPGKARRAASVGKPKRAKKAAAFKSAAPKARHTSAQKAARKGAVVKSAKPASGKPVTRRYSDVDASTVSKKETRLSDRSKLRAERYQKQTASKPRPIEAPDERKARIERSQRPDSRAKKFVKERDARESAPRANRTERTERTERPESLGRTNRTERSEKPTSRRSDKSEFKKSYQKAERPAFKCDDARGTNAQGSSARGTSDTRPTNRRDAVKAKIARTDDGRPNFEPRKYEKFDPTRPKKRSAAPDTRAANFRAERPVRDRRNDSPAYARDDFKKHSKTHSNAAVDFGANDNYISANLADANLVDATPLTEITTTFAELGIAAPLVNALSKQGIMHPFPIQIATLPDALAGHDILGRGQTGSGKTLAFGLALLNNLNGKVAKPHKPLALVLTPTRELAQQIDEVLMPLARSIGHESVVVAGGMSYAKQITAMRRGTAILVATPGRLIDLLNKGEVQLDQLQITVLDEADQMADMGFLPVVKEILDQAKLDGQRLLFSATLDRGVDSLVRQYLKNPKTHSLQNDRASVSTMEHFVLVMNPSEKDDITNQVAARNGKTILFVKTQRGADRLADKLAHAGVPVGALHGGKSQAVRTRTLALFKDTANAALVATDVAARGIHVDGISLVVHVDAPTDHKDYLHRAGRTARAGEAGTVVTLSTTRQQKSIGSLIQRAGVLAKYVGVTPLSTDLMKITGAQEPSGIPYIVPIVEKSVRSGGKRPRPNSSQRRRRPR
jgi:superfamily II DNA/RNA helicase